MDYFYGGKGKGIILFSLVGYILFWRGREWREMKRFIIPSIPLLKRLLYSLQFRRIWRGRGNDHNEMTILVVMSSYNLVILRITWSVHTNTFISLRSYPNNGRVTVPSFPFLSPLLSFPFHFLIVFSLMKCIQTKVYHSLMSDFISDAGITCLHLV